MTTCEWSYLISFADVGFVKVTSQAQTRDHHLIFFIWPLFEIICVYLQAKLLQLIHILGAFFNIISILKEAKIPKRLSCVHRFILC